MFQSNFLRLQLCLLIFLFILIGSCYSNNPDFGAARINNDSVNLIHNRHEVSNFKIEDHNLSFCLSVFQGQFIQNRSIYSLGLSEKYGLNVRFLKGGLNWRFYGKSELGFVYILDSIWSKNNDYLEFYINGTEKKNKTFESSYSLLFISQMLPTYSYIEQYPSKRRVKVSGFLNPGTLQLAYGFEYNLSEMGRVVCSLATIRIYSFDETKQQSQDNVVKKTMVKLDYGLSLDFDFKKKIINQLEIIINLHLFANSITEDRVKYNSDLCVRYRFSKYLIMQCTSRVSYDTEVSRKLVFQSQLLLGLNYIINN